MSKLSNVWVFSDNQSRLAEIMAGAAQLGDCISVFVLGTQAEISAAHALGATKVFALGEREVCRIVEDYADTMANAIAGGLGMPKDAVTAAIEAAGFDARIRPEALTLEDFAKIQNALAR